VGSAREKPWKVSLPGFAKLPQNTGGQPVGAETTATIGLILMSISVSEVEFDANNAIASRRQQNATITTYLPMVRRLARSVHAKVLGSVELDDLVQVGLTTLVTASRKFVDRGDANFMTYATTCIRGAMIDETRKLATISRTGLRRRRALHSLRARLQCEKGREPTVAEVAQSAGMSASQYARSLQGQQGISFSSLDETYSDSNPYFADPTATADKQVEERMSLEALTAAIKLLSARDQMVLQMCFVDDVPLADIGKVLGVGPARVCQIKKSALERLRNHLSDWA